MAEQIGVETTLVFRGCPVLIQAGSSATPTEVPWFYSLSVRTHARIVGLPRLGRDRVLRNPLQFTGLPTLRLHTL